MMGRTVLEVIPWSATSINHVQKIVNGVPGVSAVLHVDQQNKGEQFWWKPQMAVNVPEPRHVIVFSDHVLQEIVNGVNGVNVVPHVEQENKAEKFL